MMDQYDEQIGKLLYEFMHLNAAEQCDVVTTIVTGHPLTPLRDLAGNVLSPDAKQVVEMAEDMIHYPRTGEGRSNKKRHTVIWTVEIDTNDVFDLFDRIGNLSRDQQFSEIEIWRQAHSK